jgi:hypothetical protein
VSDETAGQVACSGHGGTPETLYARDGDLYLAYQVVGESRPDLLYVPMAIWPIDLIWDDPTVASHLCRLASFSRVILVDILGAGSSDVVRWRECGDSVLDLAC